MERSPLRAHRCTEAREARTLLLLSWDPVQPGSVALQQVGWSHPRGARPCPGIWPGELPKAAFG